MVEWIFIAVCVVIIFFASQRLRKFRTTKTEIIVSFISTAILTVMFVTALVNNFNYQRLIIISLFILIAAFNWYKLYRKYKQQIR